MKNNFKICCAILISLTAFLTGCVDSSVENNMAPVEPDERNEIDATGIIKSYNTKDIVIDFDCGISSINVKEGQCIKAGDSLVTLDIADYKSKIDNAEREINISKLELQELEDKIDMLNSETPDLKKLQNDIDYNQDLYEKYEEELKTKETLYSAGAITKYDLDEFMKTGDKIKKSLDDAEYALSAAKNDNSSEITTKQQHEVEIQKVKIENLNDQIDLMKSKLNKEYIQDNNIICDIENAVVSNIGYNAGDIVSVEKSILSLIDLNDIYVYGEIYEKDIKDISVGKEVRIIPINDKEKEYKGKVTRIYNVTAEDNGETIVPVEISFEEDFDNVIINSNVDLKIDVE